jgi:two-component system, chemotaxis family, protein-glutamate methylesterase/glutaminase
MFAHKKDSDIGFYEEGDWHIKNPDGVLFLIGEKASGYTGLYYLSADEVTDSNLDHVFSELKGRFSLQKSFKTLCHARHEVKIKKYIDQSGVCLDTIFFDRNFKTELLYKGKLNKFLAADLQKVKDVTLSPKPKIDENKIIKVLVVDDSSLIRKIIIKCIKSLNNIEVAGETGNPLDVPDLIQKLKPDVMTLDINMPERNGVEVLENLKGKIFIPTIVISSMNFTEGGMVMDALEKGAIDYIQKPSQDELSAFAQVLKEKIPIAYASKNKQSLTSNSGSKKAGLGLKLDQAALLTIGASTGGTEAIKAVLRSMPPEIPPTVIVQHIPPVFSKAFAENVDRVTPFKVKEGEDGETLRPNHVYIAPGGKQMAVVRSKGQLALDICEGEKVSGHIPSVDNLFFSIEKLKLSKVVGALLTGMGADGAKGMVALKGQGHHTIAQNEESCVVYGMPKQAVAQGGASEELHLEKIAEALCQKLVTK